MRVSLVVAVVLGFAGGAVSTAWYCDHSATRVATRPAIAVAPAGGAPRVAVPATTARVTTPTAEDQVAPRARIVGLATIDPRGAISLALGLDDAALRRAVMGDVMALWLNRDRLEAAEWLAGHPELREFDPLSAQVAAVFFPEDTELSAMFAFNIRDERTRDPLVNKLVAYWRAEAGMPAAAEAGHDARAESTGVSGAGETVPQATALGANP